MSTSTSFTRMDASTRDQWLRIGGGARQRVAPAMLDLLRSQANLNDGFSVDQLTHGLQTAWHAEQAGADEELIVAALCHDIGKALSVPNHAAIAAELLRPYIRHELAQVVYAHQDFESRYYNRHFGLDPDKRRRWAGAPWYDIAAVFADEWDQLSFDPDADAPGLAHYEPAVRDVLADARYEY
jgi:predicted HD phosphohydrolase